MKQRYATIEEATLNEPILSACLAARMTQKQVIIALANAYADLRDRLTDHVKSCPGPPVVIQRTEQEDAALRKAAGEFVGEVYGSDNTRMADETDEQDCGGK